MRSPASFLILPVPIGPRFGPPPIIPQLRPLGEATPPSSPAASYWPTTTPWLCHLLEATPPSRLCPFLLARPPLLAVPPVAPPLSLAHSPAHLCFQPSLLAHSSPCPASICCPTFISPAPSVAAHLPIGPTQSWPRPLPSSTPFYWPRPHFVSAFSLAPPPIHVPPLFPSPPLPIGPDP